MATRSIAEHLLFDWKIGSISATGRFETEREQQLADKLSANVEAAEAELGRQLTREEKITSAVADLEYWQENETI